MDTVHQGVANEVGNEVENDSVRRWLSGIAVTDGESALPTEDGGKGSRRRAVSKRMCVFACTGAMWEQSQAVACPSPATSITLAVAKFQSAAVHCESYIKDFIFSLSLCGRKLADKSVHRSVCETISHSKSGLKDTETGAWWPVTSTHATHTRAARAGLLEETQKHTCSQSRPRFAGESWKGAEMKREEQWARVWPDEEWCGARAEASFCRGLEACRLQMPHLECLLGLVQSCACFAIIPAAVLPLGGLEDLLSPSEQPRSVSPQRESWLRLDALTLPNSDANRFEAASKDGES